MVFITALVITIAAITVYRNAHRGHIAVRDGNESNDRYDDASHVVAPRLLL